MTDDTWEKSALSTTTMTWQPMPHNTTYEYHIDPAMTDAQRAKLSQEIMEIYTSHTGTVTYYTNPGEQYVRATIRVQGNSPRMETFNITINGETIPTTAAKMSTTYDCPLYTYHAQLVEMVALLGFEFVRYDFFGRGELFHYIRLNKDFLLRIPLNNQPSLYYALWKFLRFRLECDGIEFTKRI